jgi:hypothetical protein
MSDNPFDTPLPSETGAAAAPTAPAIDSANPFDTPLPSERAQSQPGALTNDVGNTVIVPKSGESFSDTMARAAKQGQQTTPAQINAEVATMPGKVATTLAAAPAIGAIGAAGLAAPGEILSGAEKVMQLSEQALEHFGENYPQLTKLAAKLGYGAGAAGAYKILNKLGVH